ncbi:MAG TPA: glycosyltransferase family 4 protein [Thermotogota bacterium]|nr:glycosyltransferase family 4 protein [Thermotogota bacterium]
MRLLILSLDRKGAGPLYAFEMAKELSKTNDLYVITSSYCEIINRWRKLKQSNQIGLLEIPTYTSIKEYLLSLIRMKTKTKSLFKYVDKIKPEAVYYGMGHRWESYIDKGLKKRKIPIFHTIHVPDFSSEMNLLRKILMYFSIKSNVKNSKGIFILSACYKENFVKKWGLNENNVWVVPHAYFSGYETTDTHLLITNKISKKKEISILFFGRIDVYKGLDTLIAAFKIAAKKDPRLRLTISGNGPAGKLIPEIPPELALKVTLDIRWIPEEEIAGIFSKADFLVLPFKTQAQSGVIALASSFNKPVITSAIGGLKEQIIDGINGLLCEPENAMAFADKILLLSSTDSLYEKIVQGIKEKREDFSWRNSTNIVIKAIKETI